MSEKKNYWTQAIGTQDALIQFGGVSSEKDVTSSFKVRALDGRHFYTMDQDGQRKGWTTLVSPGATQIITGEDLEKGQNAIFVEAENGDIIIKATDGNIRLEGDKIDLFAKEEINMEACNKIDINSNNVNIDARARMRITARQFLLIDAPCGMQILSKIIQGVSAATDKPTSYLSTGG
jgi:hypothetical protein